MEGKSVKLIENFLTWQGEGPDAGRRMIILRFKTCNLKCSWCDTLVKMRISAESTHLLTDIQNTIWEQRAGILITGGEPTVKKHFKEAQMLLEELDYPIANVESNGYDLRELILSTQTTKPVKYIYSPKIFTDTDLKEAMKLASSLVDLGVYFKIVWENGFTDAFCQWLSNEVKATYAEERVFCSNNAIRSRSDIIYAEMDYSYSTSTPRIGWKDR